VIGLIALAVGSVGAEVHYQEGTIRHYTYPRAEKPGFRKDKYGAVRKKKHSPERFSSKVTTYERKDRTPKGNVKYSTYRRRPASREPFRQGSIRHYERLD
jgi:hypothetical protein